MAKSSSSNSWVDELGRAHAFQRRSTFLHSLAKAQPTLADAILDRVVHNAYQLDLSGESIRKLKSLRAKNAKNGGTQPKGSASIAAPAAL
jgi:IstB-like ATP binding protein